MINEVGFTDKICCLYTEVVQTILWEYKTTKKQNNVLTTNSTRNYMFIKT